MLCEISQTEEDRYSLTCMWNWKKKSNSETTGCGEPEAGVEGEGEVGKDGQQAHTSSCKTHNPWGCVYSKVTVVINTVCVCESC